MATKYYEGGECPNHKCDALMIQLNPREMKEECQSCGTWIINPALRFYPLKTDTSRTSRLEILEAERAFSEFIELYKNLPKKIQSKVLLRALIAVQVRLHFWFHKHGSPVWKEHSNEAWFCRD